MRHSIYLLVLMGFVGSLSSCGSSGSSDSSSDSDSSVVSLGFFFAEAFTPYEHSTHAIHTFLDQAKTTIQALHADSSVLIDTGSLRVLLDTALLAVQQSKEAFVLADTLSKLKGDLPDLQKEGLRCAQLFEDASQNEFPQMLALMGSTSAQRTQKVDNLFHTKVAVIAGAYDSCTTVFRALKEKYHITMMPVAPSQ